MTTYAYIKNNLVTNVVLFDNPSEELLESFKNELEIDYIIPANQYCEIGGEYDESKFWKIQPYPSWIKNQETNEWDAPVPYPEVDDGSFDTYEWNEESISWVLLPSVRIFLPQSQ